MQISFEQKGYVCLKFRGKEETWKLASNYLLEAVQAAGHPVKETLAYFKYLNIFVLCTYFICGLFYPYYLIPPLPDVFHFMTKLCTEITKGHLWLNV